MTPEEIVNRGAIFALYNPAGRVLLCNAYKLATGKEVLNSSDAEVYKAYLELEKLTQKPTTK